MEPHSATRRATRSAISRLLSSFAAPSLCFPFPAPLDVAASMLFLVLLSFNYSLSASLLLVLVPRVHGPLGPRPHPRVPRHSSTHTRCLPPVCFRDSEGARCLARRAACRPERLQLVRQKFSPISVPDSPCPASSLPQDLRTSSASGVVRPTARRPPSRKVDVWRWRRHFASLAARLRLVRSWQ